MRKSVRAGRTLAVRTACVVGMTLGLSTAQAEEQYQAEIDALLKSVEKYQDPYVAVRDGYFSTVGCVHYNGEKIEEHVEYDKGAMGIHFIKVGNIGPEVDPMNPPILVYEPVDGKLQLVALEYFVPLAAATGRPSLFGHEFQGPMEGHEPLIAQDFHHYDLHLWIKENPYGMFAPTNPNVSCEGYGFALLEHATKLVPEP